MTNQHRTRITEAEAERLADRWVWKRLVTDSAYLNAEDHDSASSREEQIGIEVWAELEEKYQIS